MKKICLLLFMVLSMAANAQKKDLSTVNTVKPKSGQKMAFEAAYKTHVAKFHKAGDNINVYEILSGANAGYYHLVEGSKSYADFDKERPDGSAHRLDLDKTFFPLLENTINATYRYIDSLSLRGDVVADKFVVTVRHLNSSLDFNEYRKELARSANVNKNQKGGFWENLSYGVWEQLWDGSNQVTVSIRSLKDGFKSLETDYYGATPAGTPNFRDLYSKMYGNTAWDDRVKLMDKAVDKTEVYLMKYRPDLSTPK
jgi:hypothetical protein